MAERPRVATDRAAPAVVAVQLKRQHADVTGLAFLVVLLLGLVTTLAFLFILVADVFAGGWGLLSDRGTSFLSSNLSPNDPATAGVWQGLVGSAWIGIITVVVAFPLGIATAVYLEEYARHESRLARIVDVNIRNLAGVPSVVYGLLGLALFTKLLGTDMSEGGGLTGGRTALSAGLTMAVLVLPIVIITTAESLRAVPRALREGGYGVGATRWEVTKTLVLPSALPGILTGTVLSLSRALGETAPLLLVGVVLGSGFLSTGDANFLDQSRTAYTALPAIVFGWARIPGDTYRELTAAAIIVLLSVTLLANSIAIWLRHRYEKEW